MSSQRFFHTLVNAGRKTAQKATSGKYLLLTNTVACGCLLGAGDAAAQRIEKYGRKMAKFTWDKERTGRLFTYGLIMGPVNHFWYELLDKKLPRINIQTVLRKIVLDQAIFGPVLIVAFFIGVGCLERKSLEHNIGVAKANFLPVYKVDLCIWPAAQLLNFYLVPPHLRVIYVSAVTFGWSTFIAYYRENMQKPTSVVSSNTEPISTRLKAEGAKYLASQELSEEEQLILMKSRSILDKMKL